MVFPKKPYFSNPLSSNVHCFLNGDKISQLIDLVSLQDESIAYVIGCYYGVVQGIDILVDDTIITDPRYRLKIKVSNEMNDIEFLMYDGVVKKFAPLTCIKMEEENGSSNVYAHELEKLLGDPILFKVKKDCGCDSCGAISVEVLDFLIDSNVMEIYLNPTHDAYAHNVMLHAPINSDSVDPHELKNVGIETKATQLIIPSIQSDCSALNEFIGNIEVKLLSDLSVSKVDSTFIVMGWYDSVFEGVDMWYPDVKNCDQPRFRLKINVRDEINDTTFVLFDEQVKKLAFETCGVLLSIDGSSSMYPDELDVIYCDAILFKVNKKAAEFSNVNESYEVVGMLADPFILDKFFEHYMPSFGSIDFVAGRLSPIEIYDAKSSTEFENFHQQAASFESKRKSGRIYEQVPAKISTKRSKTT